MKGIITIDIPLSEKDFMEGMLNLRYSGRDPSLPFLFYAFKKRWHVDKFVYYKELLEERE